MVKEQELIKSALIVVGGDLKMNPKIQAIIDEADYILAVPPVVGFFTLCSSQPLMDI